MDLHKERARARALIEAGHAPRAVAVLERAVQAFPEYPDVHHDLGVALSLADDLPRAERHLRRAVELNPRFAEAQLNLAIVLFDQGNYASGRRHLQCFNALVAGSSGYPRAVVDDLARARARLADRYRAYGLLEEAEHEFQRALALCPTYVDLRLRYARVLFERGKLEACARELDAILEQRPGYDEALLLRGRIALEHGHPEAARLAWTRVRSGPRARQARAWLRLAGNGQDPGARGPYGSRLPGTRHGGPS